MRLSGNGRDSAASYRYDEFGRDLSGNQGQFQPFGYTGYRKDAVAGTYYAQAREYDAWSGRFTSEDVIKGSVAYPETLNAYGYCWGNPLVFVDRDGREPKFVSGDGYETIGTDENGVPIIKKKGQYFAPGDEYQFVGYDQTGMEIIQKKDQNNKDKEISNVNPSKYMNESNVPDYLINGGLESAGKICTVAMAGVEIYTDCKENKENNAEWEEYAADIIVDLEFVILGAAIGSIIPGAGTLAGAILGAIVGLIYYTITDVITYNKKSLKDWNKDGTKSLIEFLESEIGDWMKGMGKGNADPCCD